MGETLASRAPSVSEVARIAAMENVVIRNLEITECYSRLSDSMREHTGGAANWCTFATWASRQAGSTIRGEDLLDDLKRRLGADGGWLAPLQTLNRRLLRKGLYEPNSKFGRAVAEIHTPFDAFERASSEVAAGNLKVFEEIGMEFARYLAEVPADAGSDSKDLSAFLDELSPGPPPDGQEYLREAFLTYQRLRNDSDPKVRAGWILLANLQIGLHEQTRLQPRIAAAVDAPITTAENLGMRVLHALIPGSRTWSRIVHAPLAWLIKWPALWMQKTAVRITREVVTESMMFLTLPKVVLSLGQNLNAPVPPNLTGSLPNDVETFLKEYDPCPPGGIACGATDWCDLRQRMHYILHLFRAYADEESLFSPPFTPQQVMEFRGGRVPDGDV